MDFFEKDGEIFKRIPAGGHGGGITGAFPVKASPEEAAAYREAHTVKPHPHHGLADVEKAAAELDTAVAAAEKDDTQ